MTKGWGIKTREYRDILMRTDEKIGTKVKVNNHGELIRRFYVCTCAFTILKNEECKFQCFVK
jgi:hypothetical protein